MSHKADPLFLTAAARWTLENIVEQNSVSPMVMLRVRIILGAPDGLSNHELAAQLSTSRPTVIKWRSCWIRNGIQGLRIPRTPPQHRTPRLHENAIVNEFYSGRPPIESLQCEWKTSTLAKKYGVSRSTVQRVWTDYSLKIVQLWRTHVDPESFIISLDPYFGHRIVEVGPFFHHTHDRSLAFLALPGKRALPDACFVEAVTDPVRHGSIDELMRSLNELEKDQVSFSKPGFPPTWFLANLERIASELSTKHLDLEVHLVCESSQDVFSEPSIQEWLLQHPAFILHINHYVPWIDCVRRWFEVMQASGRRPPPNGTKELTACVNSLLTPAAREARNATRERNLKYRADLPSSVQAELRDAWRDVKAHWERP